MAQGAVDPVPAGSFFAVAGVLGLRKSDRSTPEDSGEGDGGVALIEGCV